MLSQVYQDVLLQDSKEHPQKGQNACLKLHFYFLFTELDSLGQRLFKPVFSLGWIYI